LFGRVAIASRQQTVDQAEDASVRSRWGVVDPVRRTEEGMMFERCGQNAIADATIVQTLKGRIKRAPPAEQEAARRAILDLALQAVYDRRLIEITESATSNQPTELRLWIGREERLVEPPPSSDEIGLDREHCAAIVGGRVVKLTPGTMAILTALIEAGGGWPGGPIGAAGAGARSIVLAQRVGQHIASVGRWVR
jgi:hypothetical protein